VAPKEAAGTGSSRLKVAFAQYLAVTSSHLLKRTIQRLPVVSTNFPSGVFELLGLLAARPQAYQMGRL